MILSTTTQTLLLLKLCLSPFTLLLSLENLLGTLAFGFFPALRPLDALQFGILARECTTFNITSADTKGSTHLIHLCLFGSGQCMRIGWLEVANVDVRTGLRLRQEPSTQCRDF